MALSDRNQCKQFKTCFKVFEDHSLLSFINRKQIKGFWLRIHSSFMIIFLGNS
jgi:hypothetical protein